MFGRFICLYYLATKLRDMDFKTMMSFRLENDEKMRLDAQTKAIIFVDGMINLFIHGENVFYADVFNYEKNFICKELEKRNLPYRLVNNSYFEFELPKDYTPLNA